MKPNREIFCRFLLTTVIILSNACTSEFGGPNPQNYEDYVGSRDKQPAFSPDGKQIAYYHDSYETIEPADYPSGLYIVNANGTNRIKVLSGHHYSPAWSPDGRWLVFSTQGVIQKCKVNGDSLTRFEGIDEQGTSVEDGLFFPDWSPSGNKIVFSKSYAPEGGLYYTTSDFLKSGRMFDLRLETGSQPELSPDGHQFIFCKGDQSFEGGIELFLMDTLGTNEKRLTQNNSEDLGPTWDPDGQRIAWSADVMVYTMSVDGANQTFLSYGQYPSWSVDDVIVFSQANADYSKEVLYSIHPDGSNKTQITF